MLKYILFLIFSVALAAPLLAQQALFFHYTTRDGLPSNIIYDVYQDTKGFVWFCSDHGVSRFDGREFRNYSVKDGLPDTDIFRIREDDLHRLWLISFNGKAGFIWNDSVYTSATNILCCCLEKAGIYYDELFRGMDGYCYLAGNRLVRLLPRAPYFQIVPGLTLRDACHLRYFRKGDKEYITSYNTLYDLQTKNHQLFPESMRCSFFYGKYLFLSVWSKKNSFLEQWEWENDSVRLLKKIQFPFVINEVKLARAGVLNCYTTNGVMEYSIASGKKTTLDVPGKVNVSRAIWDKDQNWWLSTLTDGVYMKPARGGTVFNTASGLARNNILSLCTTPDGKLVYGDDEGHVGIIEKGKTTIRTLGHRNIGNRILHIHPADSGLMVVCSDQAFYIINLHNNMHEAHYVGASKSAVSKGRIIMVAFNGGIFTYDRHTGKVAIRNGTRSTALILDHQGLLWVGQNKGISYYKEGVRHSYNGHASLSSSRITCMTLSREGYVVTGTGSDGLFIIKDYRQPAVQLSQRDGLRSNNCRKLFAAKDGTIWLCSEEGIDQLNMDKQGKYIIKPFALPRQLSGNDINDLMIRDTDLLLATSKGIFILDSKNNTAALLSGLYLSAVNGHSVAEGNEHTVLTFPYKERNVQVTYVGVSFPGAAPLQFRYVLRGATDDTVYTSEHTLNFSALNPGNYELLLWGRCSGSKWTSHPLSLRFNIRPPFWLHPLSITATALILAGTILLLYKRRIEIVRRRAERIATTKQQLAELEMKALRAQINPHFVFNALNSIQSYYSLHDELKANHYMTSFARFIRLTLIHSQSHWLPLAEELDMLRIYVELEQARFKDLFSYTINVAPGINLNETVIPAMLIQPYAENAINHGLRHLKGRKGLLRLGFSVDKGILLCTIDDNGVGMQYYGSDRPAKHTSLGMNINRQRIDTINRMYNILIKIDIKAKFDDTGTPAGTCISLLIPLKQ